MSAMRGKITSLLYHQVDDSSRTHFLARGGAPIIEPKDFRKEMRFLTGLGVRFFTFDQIATGIFPDVDELGVAVCFDDCFVNNYTSGLQVLQEVGVKATYFQSTAMVDAATLLWEHRLYWHTRNDDCETEFRKLCLRILPNDGSLDTLRGRQLVDYLREDVPFTKCEQLLKIADAQLSSPSELAAVARQIYPTARQLCSAQALGHEIASHGHRHLKRANISETEFDHELACSATALREITGAPPTSFSYPFDSHLPTDSEIVRRYFKSAATVAKRPIVRGFDPLWLPRFTWPGPAKNGLRMRRWLLTGTI